MLSVHTKQLTTAGDNPVARWMRAVEDRLLALFRWLRVSPPAHRLAGRAHEFTRPRPSQRDRRGGASPERPEPGASGPSEQGPLMST